MIFRHDTLCFNKNNYSAVNLRNVLGNKDLSFSLSCHIPTQLEEVFLLILSPCEKLLHNTQCEGAIASRDGLNLR